MTRNQIRHWPCSHSQWISTSLISSNNWYHRHRAANQTFPDSTTSLQSGSCACELVNLSSEIRATPIVTQMGMSLTRHTDWLIFTTLDPATYSPRQYFAEILHWWCVTKCYLRSRLYPILNLPNRLTCVWAKLTALPLATRSVLAAIQSWTKKHRWRMPQTISESRLLEQPSWTNRGVGRSTGHWYEQHVLARKCI